MWHLWFYYSSLEVLEGIDKLFLRIIVFLYIINPTKFLLKDFEAQKFLNGVYKEVCKIKGVLKNLRWPAHISFGIGSLALFLTLLSIYLPDYGYWGLSEWLFGGAQNWAFVIVFSLVILFIITPYLSVAIDWFDHEMDYWSWDALSLTQRIMSIPLSILWAFGGLLRLKPEKRWLHDYVLVLIPLILAYIVTVFLPAIIPQWFFLLIVILLFPTLSHIFLDNFTKMGVKFAGIWIRGFLDYDHKGANYFFVILGQLALIGAIIIFLFDILFIKNINLF